jgi:hypothetical protein
LNTLEATRPLQCRKGKVKQVIDDTIDTEPLESGEDETFDDVNFKYNRVHDSTF